MLDLKLHFTIATTGLNNTRWVQQTRSGWLQFPTMGENGGGAGGGVGWCRIIIDVDGQRSKEQGRELIDEAESNSFYKLSNHYQKKKKRADKILFFTITELKEKFSILQSHS